MCEEDIAIILIKRLDRMEEVWPVNGRIEGLRKKALRGDSDIRIDDQIKCRAKRRKRKKMLKEGSDVNK